MKRLAIGYGLLALAAEILVGSLFFVQYRQHAIDERQRAIDESRPGVISQCNYEKIKIGMTVSEVEAILGPSQEMAPESLPRHPDGPVVHGERFFNWKEKTLFRTIWIATRSDKVCDKWYLDPERQGARRMRL